MNSLFKNRKTIIRVVLYLRLSDEDRDKLTKEELSESIKNQEILLRNFASEHDNWEIIGVYNDEDWSGSDVTRPDFNRMIEECKCGNVDLVLCKTQSRFARDMELVEKYVHNLFHEWNVRFITVVDRIDNFKRETKKTSQILGLTDEWYLEDTSLNIRQTFLAKRKKGELTASFTAYGYLKDPENKNHLVIDQITSNIVRRIYDEYLSGNGLNKIANNLNKDKVLSPYEYKLMNGSKLKIPLINNFIDYGYIDKVGTYIVDISFTNTEDHIIKDLVSFNYITTDRKTINHRCDIILKRYLNSKTKVYYSEKDNLDINNFDENDYILLHENDIIPKTATVIATFTKNLDRTHITNYQLEVILKENRVHDRFYIDIKNSNINDISKSKFIFNIRKKFGWSQQTIRKILTDEVYIGNLVQFKSTTVSYKNHTVIYNDSEERIRKDNTHEPIIKKEIWYKVQERMKKKSRSCKCGKIHAFSNKIYCLYCNKIFSKCGKNDINGFGYLCCKDKKEKWMNCCNKKYIREEDLHRFVLLKINSLLCRFYDEDILCEMYDNRVNQRLFQDELKSLEKEIQSIEKELQNKIVYFQKLYNDRINEILSEKEFLILMNKYKDDSLKLEDRARVLKKELAVKISKKKSIKSNQNIFRNYKCINELSIEIIDDFIEKIFIGNYDEETNSREIKIVWNFTFK